MVLSLKSAEKPDPSIIIGRVTRPHGVQGELRVEPLTDFPERFETLESVYIDLPNGTGRWWEVESVREGTDSAILMTLDSVTNPEDALLLRHGMLMLPREKAMPLPEDVYYIDDLKGLRADAEDGTTIGVVNDVYSAAQDVLEIRTEAGQDILVPLVKAWVPVVNVKEGFVVVANWQDLVLEAAPDPNAPPKKPKFVRPKQIKRKKPRPRS